MYIFRGVYFQGCIFSGVCIFRGVYFRNVYFQGCIFSWVYIFRDVYYFQGCIFSGVYIFRGVYFQGCIFAGVYIIFFENIFFFPVKNYFLFPEGKIDDFWVESISKGDKNCPFDVQLFIFSSDLKTEKMYTCVFLFPPPAQS